MKQRDFAQELGINPNTLRSYENGRALPNQELLEAVCVKFLVNADWLLTGAGSMRAGEQPVDSEPPHARQETNDAARADHVPVIGLASCGVSGWYNTNPIAMSASPLSAPSTGAFAVIAVGSSMNPEGIRQGYLLFCNPTASPNAGDVVFVARNDGTASVKLFLDKDDGWVYLQGWLDPDENGFQKPFGEKVALGFIKDLTVVTTIRRRA